MGFLLAAAGLGAQLVGQLKGARDAKAASDWNREQNRLYSEYNAEAVLSDAESRIDLFQEQGEEFISTQRAIGGASGVTTGKGSSLELMVESARKIDRDVQTMRRNAQSKAQSIRFGADVESFKSTAESDMFARRAKAGTITTLLSGAAGLYDQYGTKAATGTTT